MLQNVTNVTFFFMLKMLHNVTSGHIILPKKIQLFRTLISYRDLLG